MSDLLTLAVAIVVIVYYLAKKREPYEDIDPIVRPKERFKGKE